MYIYIYAHIYIYIYTHVILARARLRTPSACACRWRSPPCSGRLGTMLAFSGQWSPGAAAGAGRAAAQHRTHRTAPRKNRNTANVLGLFAARGRATASGVRLPSETQKLSRSRGRRACLRTPRKLRRTSRQRVSREMEPAQDSGDPSTKYNNKYIN